MPIALLTFDGGHDTTYEVAYPILAAAGFVATVYVVSDRIGTEGYMTLAQFQELNAAGWDIANHTDDHGLLDDYGDPADVAEHITDCAAVLDAAGMTRASLHMAYPGGHYDTVTLAGMVLAGALTGRTTASGYSCPVLAHRYEEPTALVVNNPTAAWATGCVDVARLARKAVIFTLHGLVESPSIPEEWQPDRFQALVDYLETSQAEVLTISQWYARFA